MGDGTGSVRRTRKALLSVMCAAVAFGGCGEPIGEERESLDAFSPQSVVPLTLGGPVILGGDDLTDHGSYNSATGQVEDGWFYIKKALQNIKVKVTRPNNGTVAVLGASDSTAISGNAGGAYHYASPQAGLTPQFYNGAAALESFFNALRNGTVQPAIIVASGTGALNNLDAAEGVVLTNNAVTMADFVNSGGGLLSHGSGPIAYGWLTTLLPGVLESTGCNVNTLSLTADGQTAFPGLTNSDIRTGPCHSHFSGNLGDLKVLAKDGTPWNIIIGGAAVQLPGAITLQPVTVTYIIGVTSSHTVTAKVQDGSLNPVAGATVTFSVNTGPNAGNTGTAVTNAQGLASFTYNSSGTVGTDNITASYNDNGTIRTSPTVQAIWQPPPNVPPTPVPGGPYSTPEGSSVTLDASGSSDPDGDALTFGWELDLQVPYDYDEAFGPTLSFFGADGPATHSVGFKVCDTHNACSTAFFPVTVINVAPTTSAGADQTVNRNATVFLSGTFTDPAGAADNPYAWSWDLDGNGAPDASGAAAYGATVTASTSFAAAGTYTLTFRVTDKDGGSHSDTVVITVLNRPPVAVAGGPYSTPEGSSASLDGSASSDPDGDALTYAWDLDNDGAYDDALGATTSFFGADGPAVHTVGLRVCDGDNACGTATTTVTVINVAPTANAGADQTVYRNAAVSLSGTFTDPAGAADDLYAWSWDLDGDGTPDASGTTAYGSTVSALTSFAASGTYTLTFQVADKDGGSHSDTVVITVINSPPDCSAAAPSISLLWPPNHRMEPVSILGVTDPDNDSVTVTVTSIYQDEPVDDIADGHTGPDGDGVGTSTAVVRAERSGSPRNPGNGRVYHIGFTATDGDLSCSGTVTVGVPHDQGGQSIPVDDGPLYDSTVP